MQRSADHDQRRRQITDGARRVIASGGLAAATFQSIAAEAGVSVRLLQYYFGSKRNLLRATHGAVVADAGQRMSRCMAAVGADAAPRAVVRAVLEELLPTDESRRRDAIVLGAFHAAAVNTDSLEADSLTGEETLGAPSFLVDLVAGQLRAARSCSPRSTRRDRATDQRDAQLVVAAAAGLSQRMLVDPDTPAVELLDRLLDLLIGATPPAR